MKSIVLLLLTIGYTYGQSVDCDHFESADSCMQSLLLLGDPDHRFPLNEIEMGRYCRSIENTAKCVDNYSVKCLDRFARQMTSVLVNGAVKTGKGYCSSQSKKDAFISMGVCANIRKQSLDYEMNEYIEKLQGINNSEQKGLKIPLLCCHFNQFKSNVLQVSRDDTQPKCTERVVTEIERLIDGLANDVLIMICPQEYMDESSDKCSTIIPLTPPKDSNQLNYKSLLLPLINIFNSLKN